MSAPQDPSRGEDPDSGLKIWNCVACRRRKIRCDRRDPCANCVKSNVDCHYPVTGRVPHRRRGPGTWKSPTQKQSELLSRLRRLETVVTELAGQVEEGSVNRRTTPSSSGAGSSARAEEALANPATASHTEQTSIHTPPSNSQAGSEFDEDFGRLVVDKDGGLHVGNRFWSVFCSEVDNILEAVHDVAEYSAEPPAEAAQGDSRASPGPRSFFFGNKDTIGALDNFKPSPLEITVFQERYTNCVDPFIKILHIPSMNKMMVELREKSIPLDSSTEALLSAISFAALATMDEQLVRAIFDTERAPLVAKYRSAVEQALARADFLVTKDIVVLQAFTIYLSILPYFDATPLAWSLTGVLIRLAKVIGLHTELSNAGRTILDAELRRRLWWQICFIDSRTRKSAMGDMSISRSSFDTSFPAELNDWDLVSEPQSWITQGRPKDTTLCLIRCEIWQLVESLRAIPNHDYESRFEIFNETKSRVTNLYLQCEQEDNSWGRFIINLTSLFFAKVELVLHHLPVQGSNSALKTTGTLQSHSPNNGTISQSLAIIQAVHSLKTGWSNWRWQFQGEFPWHAAGIFLQQASRQEWIATFERAWEMTNSLVEMMPVSSKAGPLWEPLQRILARTSRHRNQELARLASQGITLPAVSEIDLEHPLPSGDHISRATDNLRLGGTIEDMQIGWAGISLSSAPLEAAESGLSFEPTPQVFGGTGASFGAVDVDNIDWESLGGLEGMDLVWDMIDF